MLSVQDTVGEIQRLDPRVRRRSRLHRRGRRRLCRRLLTGSGSDFLRNRLRRFWDFFWDTGLRGRRCGLLLRGGLGGGRLRRCLSLRLPPRGDAALDVCELRGGGGLPALLLLLLLLQQLGARRRRQLRGAPRLLHCIECIEMAGQPSVLLLTNICANYT